MRALRPCFLLLTLLAISLQNIAVAQAVVSTIPIGQYPTGSAPQGVAVNSATNKIYVAEAGLVTVIDGSTRNTIDIPINGVGVAVGVNQTTNMIYVPEIHGPMNCQDCVAVINGATNSLAAEVPVGSYPDAVAVNPTTNKIYIANTGSNSVTVLDGGTLTTTSISIFSSPTTLAVNPVTNMIYVIEPYGLKVDVIDGTTNYVQPIQVGLIPVAIAVNTVTNKIYVANLYDMPGDISVIDGVTLAVTYVPVGQFPSAIGVNPVTNKIYVVNQFPASGYQYSGAVTVIDGNTLETTTINDTPSYQPYFCTGEYEIFPSCPVVAVDAAANKIYIEGTAQLTSALTAINGATNTSVVLGLGDQATGMAFDATNDTIYVPNYYDSTVSIVEPTAKLQFVPISPCRVVDTRNPDGPFGGPPIHGFTQRDFPLPQGACNLPGNSVAYALNVSVVPHGRLGYLTVFPTSEQLPATSTLNSLDGRIKANAAIVQGGVNAGVTVFASDTTDVILDVAGYFIPSTSSTLALFALPPCRVIDTRRPAGPLGGPALQGSSTRSFPVLDASECNIPSTAQAYSLNVTAIPHGALRYLTVWPSGENQPVVSTLNAPTGTIVANAALVQSGTSGAVSVYTTDNTDLVIDINGYFAAPASGPNPLSLYTLQPCRVLDTRRGRGGEFSGELVIDALENGYCPTSPQAQAYTFNAAVVPMPRLGYLALWPDGENQPVVATLNAIDGAITSNMAIVPTTNGLIDAYAAGLTQLILDMSSYFAP